MKNKSEKLLKLVESSADVNKSIIYLRKKSARLLCLAVLLLFVFYTNSDVFGQIWGIGVQPGRVFVIPVIGEIDLGLSFFVQRILRRAEKEQAAMVVLEINSNGGLINAAQEIKDALLATKVPTLAFIKGRALSAAALIAISCQKIAMTPGSEMGAATPVMLVGPSVQAAEAKYISAFRAEFESTAEARRRPKALAAAMVDKNHETIPGLVNRGEILTLTTETAHAHGFCDIPASSLEYALTKLNVDTKAIERVEPTSGENIARYLTNPNISVLLFTAGIWCLIIEFLVVGWGILGWLGLILLALFFGGHLFAYLAGMEALILFMLGIILLIIEIFAIPGFGITGVLGILGISFSIILAFGGIYTAVWAIAKMIALSIVAIIILYFVGPKIRLFDRFILKEKLGTEEGFVAVDTNQFKHLLNMEGETLSPCRPSGIARINNQRVDVVSEGEFIERNQKIIVVAVEGTKIVVRKLNA